MSNDVSDSPEAVANARLSISLPPKQNAALDKLALSTGLSKTDLIRQAVGLLTIAVTANDRGLVLALANEDDKVLTRIVSTL